MNKLMIALIASTFAATAAAQTGTVNTATVGDHGTPAMHAAETKKNVEASKAVTGLPADAMTKQQVAKDATTAGTDNAVSGAVASAKGAARAKTEAGTPKVLATKADKEKAVAATTAEATKINNR